MVGLLKGMRDAGKTIFVVTHQAALLEGAADEFVWMQSGQIVDRTASIGRAGAPMTLWSVTLATLKKDIRLEWRSKDALNSMLFFSLLVVVIFRFSFDPLAEESRHIVGGLVWVGFLVRRGGGAQSDLGARVAQSGARCLPRFSGAGQCAVPGQGAGQFYFRQRAGSADDAAVRDFLQPARPWARRGS